MEIGVNETLKSDLGMHAQLESFRRLLGAKLDPRAKDRFRFTDLHWATIANNPPAVKHLLENGADPRIAADNGYGTAWDSPAYRRTVSTREFRDRISRFNVDLKKHYWGVRDLTALHVAASENSVPIIELLHAYGASFKLKDYTALTPIHVAVSSGAWQAFDTFLNFGFDIDEKDHAQRTLLHWVAFYRADQRVGIFLGGSFPPIYWGQMDPAGAAAALLERNANVSVRDLSSNTPLHLAAATDKRDLAEVLLHHGAQADARNRARATPLHLAAWFNSIETAELLLAHGVHVNSKDSAGNSPLHIATADDALEAKANHIPGGSCCHREGPNVVVRLLVENGADICAENNEGFTPLRISKGKRLSDDTFQFLSQRV